MQEFSRILGVNRLRKLPRLVNVRLDVSHQMMSEYSAYAKPRLIA